MALVPGGEFTTQLNKRKVAVADLCVDITETTVKSYDACVKAGKCSTDNVNCAVNSTHGKPDKQDHPMVCVDFAQANAFCEYKQARLPETGEWEWVARGGAALSEYPWGNDKPGDQLCWGGKEQKRGACAVGQFPAGDTPQGLKDIAGNVLEFTTTAQDAKSPVRIARGGSWKDGTTQGVWPARIGGFGVTYRCAFLGIRCVVEAKPAPAP